MLRDNTRLGRELARLEAEDPAVRAAGERLDEVIRDIASGHAAFVRELYRDSRGDSPQPLDKR